MGFNNKGSEIVLENLLQSRRRNKVVGVNLGKNKVTSNEEAPKDYQMLYDTFADKADYLVVNVSSPNTPGLRDLLKDKGLRDIFEALQNSRQKINKPLFVKVSPDMSDEELLSVVGLANEYKLAGIIATNTTIMAERGEGGMSGAILYQKAKKVRETLLNELRATHSSAELIGVGGFSKFEDLMEFWSAGGKLTQIYSSFIFQGPAFLYEIENRLLSEMNKKGVKNFEEFCHSLSK
jgi:dihydroorotate dehydrogenase